MKAFSVITGLKK